MKRRTQRPFDYMAPHLQAYQRPPEPAPLVDAEPDEDLGIAHGAKRGPPPFAFQVAEAADAPLVRRGPSDMTAEPRYRRPLPEPQHNDAPFYALGAFLALFLAAAPTAFWIGALRKSGPFQFDGFTFTLLGVLGLILGGGAFAVVYSLRQGARLASEARFARRQAEEMLQPAMLASAGAGSIVEAVRIEIEQAAAAAAQARHELKTLSEVLAAETSRLSDAASQSARTATSLTASISHEREGLGELSSSLEKQILQVSEAVGRQARMVAEASDLAEAQMREAEASLVARAADIVAAAGQTTDATRIASEDLSRQTVRLETAGAAVSEQIQSLEEGLAEQRAALVALSHAMRADQEDFAAQIESQQAQLTELLSQAMQGADELRSTTLSTGETMRALVADAAGQVKSLSETAAQERENFSASALSTVGALAEAVRHERQGFEAESRETIEALARAAEEARQAAALQADTARRRIDELGEAAFAAGQKADAVFEARYSEAQALIAQSANLVEEAGLKTSERMTASLAAAREAAEDFERLLRDVEERAARLPVDTQERSAEVKAVVDQGVDELLSVARKAAEETQAIDAAFQERVRRNYEMLSEAVRLMGVVSGSGSTRASRPSRADAELPSISLRSRTSFSPAVAPPSTEVAEGQTALAEAPALESLPPEQASAEPQDAPTEAVEPTAEELGLRPRLKLTPTEADEEVAALFEPAQDAADGESAAAEGDGWTWKDLLSSIDGEPNQPDRLGDRMIEEISELGIDPAALMPSGRIEQIAAAMQGGDRIGAREVVRRLAPAAVRRLSRRVLTDIALRSQTDRFLERYEAMSQRAIEEDPTGERLNATLASDHGRAFLLMDTAVGGVG